MKAAFLIIYPIYHIKKKKKNYKNSISFLETYLIKTDLNTKILPNIYVLNKNNHYYIYISQNIFNLLSKFRKITISSNIIK